MKYVLLIITLSIVIAPLNALSDDTFVEAGVGIFSSGVNTLAETKLLMVGRQTEVWGPFVNRYGVGGWTDCAGNGRSDSAFFSDQIGFEVVTGTGTYASVYSGPTAITATDAYLGGHFQFQEDVHLGIQDQQSNSIGVMYKHFSSAGIYTPNIGRDFMGVEIKF
jgi:hypothetical protein